MGRNVENLPEIAYHYSGLRNKKNILKKGLLATDNYSCGDIPVVWFYCKRNDIITNGGGGVEVRVKVDSKDPNWRIDWGGDWDSIVYTGNILPENLEVENTLVIAKSKWRKQKKIKTCGEQQTLVEYEKC